MAILFRQDKAYSVFGVNQVWKLHAEKLNQEHVLQVSNSFYGPHVNGNCQNKWCVYFPIRLPSMQSNDLDLPISFQVCVVTPVRLTLIYNLFHLKPVETYD